MLKKIALIALCSISAFALESIGLNINDKDLSIMAKFDMSKDTAPKSMTMGIGFLNAHVSNSDDVNYSNDGDVDYLTPLIEGNFLIISEIENSGTYIGLGVKINATKNDEDMFLTMPLGLEIDYIVPTLYYMPMKVGISAYYSPNSLSFMDADNYTEYNLHYDIQVINNAIMSIGYRMLETNYNSYDLKYNSSAYFGFKAVF
jgi:hypothetical protein